MKTLIENVDVDGKVRTKMESLSLTIGILY